MIPWNTSMFLAVGLASVGTFLFLETFKPSLIYDDKTGLPKNELLTPVTIGVAVGLLVLLWHRKYRPGSGMSSMISGTGRTMRAATLDDGMPLNDMEGFVPAREPTLPPQTFEES